MLQWHFKKIIDILPESQLSFLILWLGILKMQKTSEGGIYTFAKIFFIEKTSLCMFLNFNLNF